MVYVIVKWCGRPLKLLPDTNRILLLGWLLVSSVLRTVLADGSVVKCVLSVCLRFLGC